jgi:hypothetical protein
MVVIVRFDVGGDWMVIEWCGWFGWWVNGGRGGRCKMCGFGGLCFWYGCRHTWCWCMLGLVACLLYILLSGHNQMARAEQIIRGVTVECGGRPGADFGVSTIPLVVHCGGS